MTTVNDILEMVKKVPSSSVKVTIKKGDNMICKSLLEGVFFNLKNKYASHWKCESNGAWIELKIWLDN